MGFGPSPMEIAVIAVIALIVLGPARLPEMAKSLGKGMREMRGALSGDGGGDSSRRLDDADEDEDDEDDPVDDDAPDPIDLDASDEAHDDEDLEFRSSSSDVDAKPAASA